MHGLDFTSTYEASISCPGLVHTTSLDEGPYEKIIQVIGTRSSYYCTYDRAM